MTYHFDKMNAVAEDASNTMRPIRMPPNLDARNVVSVLSHLGVMIPTAVAAAAAKDNLRTAGHRFTNKEVDTALARGDLSITERIAFKTAMGAHGILER